MSLPPSFYSWLVSRKRKSSELEDVESALRNAKAKATARELIKTFPKIIKITNSRVSFKS